MKQNVDKTIRDIFYNVQFSKTRHNSCLKKLKKCYEQCSLSDFWRSFESCFRVPLSIAQRHPQIESTLEFVGKFAASLYSFSDDESEELLCPFLLKLFNFVLTNHGAKDPAVRFRICHFLNILLNSMGDQAFIDDALCDKITHSMMSRLLDKSPKVRAQAIFALHRLQDPTDDQCPVIKMYTFHATKDPRAEVRKAALNSMGKSQKTLQVALRRTKDVNEGVRKTAYEFISKITIRSLTITQRDQLLNEGLKDRSEMVKKTVENVLLPSWVRHFNGDLISLVRALDAEIGTDVSSLALKVQFKCTPLNALIEQLPINKDTKLIPIDKLSSENVLYWKCLVIHVQQECAEELDEIIPELSSFCAYISDYLAQMAINPAEKWVSLMQKFILLQLFEMTTTYDLADEVGRQKLNELICNTLMGSHWSDKIIECIVTHLEKIIPDTNSKLDTLTNIISEIRLPLKEPLATQISEQQQEEINVQKAKLKVQLLELKEDEYQAIKDKQYLTADRLKNEINELHNQITKLSEGPQITCTPMEEINEKNDPDTMIKCLTIMCTMMQSVTVLTPTLRSLMQMVLDSLDHTDINVHMLAIKALSIYCILDKTLAKQHIITLFLQFSIEEEHTNIWIMALKGIFDLLLMYGLEYFGITESANETTNKTDKSRTRLYTSNDTDLSLSSARKSETGRNSQNFIKILAGLLDNENQELRTLAAEGLCKLLLNRRIACSNLLTKLIILCFNPVNAGDYYLRQCLSAFFEAYINRVSDALALLEEAYLPTLQTLCNAPEISPLQEIDAYEVSTFMLNLTKITIRKPGVTYSAHNNIAFTILAEVLNPDSNISQEILIKSLKHLRLELEDATSKENILKATDRVTDMIGSDKRLLKDVEIFKTQLSSFPYAENPPQDEETEPENWRI